MDERKRKRCPYVTARQKKKLIELMTKHPELISCKLTHHFNYKDSQKLWQNIANECNAIPGARKTWKQWRKTWHDLRSNTKKKQSESSGVVRGSITLTAAEQEALGLKTKASSKCHVPAEFVTLEENSQANFCEEMNDCTSEPDVEEEEDTKLFDSSNLQSNIKMSKRNPEHKCFFSINFMAVQEQRKRKMKEEYFTFKKEYLSQKLKLMKMQTEALTSIAKGLSQS